MKDREYKRVMAFVKDGIRSGEFRVGSKLPTEREMAETLGMSRPSIREALKSCLLYTSPSPRDTR